MLLQVSTWWHVICP